jgi:hypothetical protein
VLPIVDISEASAANKNKKITYGELLSSAPSGSAAAPSFSFDSDPNTGIFNPTADTLAFAEGGAEVMRIDSSGRLLVGTSSVTGVQHSAAAGTFDVDPKSQINTLSAPCTLLLRTDFPSNESGSLLALAKSRGSGVNSNTIVANGDTLGEIGFFGADGTDIRSFGASIQCRVDGTPGANDMPGRLVFSTTADGAASPTERMRIRSTGWIDSFSSASDTFVVRSSSAAGTTNFLFRGTNVATGTADGTVAIQVFTNGNVQNTNNSYGAISDLKLKENIVDASSQWGDLKALQVRKYNFKEGQTHTQIGLVAQEVELVSPGLVNESPDRDEDGNDLGTVTKSVNYSVLYMKAVKALQEAMERIETLEARLTAAGIE